MKNKDNCAVKEADGNSLNEKYMSVFATRLRNILDTRGISQYQFAKDIGTTSQNVSHYCLGNSTPHPSMLVVIARKLNVSIDYLMGLTDNESINPEIRSISAYTGLTTDSIEALHKYRVIPLFIDVVNFLLTDLKLLEATADFMTTPFLEAVKNAPYDHVNLALPIFDNLSELRALELNNCAAFEQKLFAKQNVTNSVLKEYVADRYVAKYSTGSRSCVIPTQTKAYTFHDMLYSICENESRTEYEEFLQSVEFFGISDIDYIKAIKLAEKNNVTNCEKDESK